MARRAIAIRNSALGAEHPAVAAGCSVLTRILPATNRLQEAELEITRAMEIMALHGKNTEHDHPSKSIIIENYRETLTRIGLDKNEINKRLKKIFS